MLLRLLLSPVCTEELDVVALDIECTSISEQYKNISNTSNLLASENPKHQH